LKGQFEGQIVSSISRANYYYYFILIGVKLIILSIKKYWF